MKEDEFMNNLGWCPLWSSNDGSSESKCRTDKCAFWDKEETDCILFSLKKSVDKITGGYSTNLDDVCSKVSNVESNVSSVQSELVDVNSNLSAIKSYLEEINLGIDDKN